MFTAISSADSSGAGGAGISGGCTAAGGATAGSAPRVASFQGNPPRSSGTAASRIAMTRSPKTTSRPLLARRSGIGSRSGTGSGSGSGSAATASEGPGGGGGSLELGSHAGFAQIGRGCASGNRTVAFAVELAGEPVKLPGNPRRFDVELGHHLGIEAPDEGHRSAGTGKTRMNVLGGLVLAHRLTEAKRHRVGPERLEDPSSAHIFGREENDSHRSIGLTGQLHEAAHRRNRDGAGVVQQEHQMSFESEPRRPASSSRAASASSATGSPNRVRIHRQNSSGRSAV